MVGALPLSSAFFQFFSFTRSGSRRAEEQARPAHPVNRISTMPPHPESSMFRGHIGLDLTQRPAAIREDGFPASLKTRPGDAVRTDIWPFFAIIGTH